MTKTYKITTGFFAWTPLILFSVALVLFLLAALISLFGIDVPFEEILFFGIIFPSFVIGGLLYLISIIVFLVIVLRNKTFNKEDRMIWVIVMLFGGSAGQPAYWLSHIHKKHKLHEYGRKK